MLAVGFTQPVSNKNGEMVGFCLASACWEGPAQVSHIFMDHCNAQFKQVAHFIGCMAAICCGLVGGLVGGPSREWYVCVVKVLPHWQCHRAVDWNEVLNAHWCCVTRQTQGVRQSLLMCGRMQLTNGGTQAEVVRRL